MEDLREWAAEHGLRDDPRFMGRLRELEVKVAGARALSLRMIAAVDGGGDSTVLATANKPYFTELCQEIARVAVDFSVPEAIISGTMVEFLWRNRSWLPPDDPPVIVLIHLLQHLGLPAGVAIAVVCLPLRG